jgi:GT2 family glycosyltransferase
MAAGAPIRVVHVETGQPLPAISPLHPDGARYAAALVFVRDDGVPVGRRQIELGEAVLSPGELAVQLHGLWHERPSAPRRTVSAEAPFISVVVPSAMQRPRQLRHCIGVLAGLDYPAFEIVVVDNRPSRDARRVSLHAELALDSRVRVVEQPQPGASAARNRGIEAAEGTIIAFTDDDIEVDPGWLAAIADRFSADPKTDCVTGHVLPAELETLPQVWFENSGRTIGKEYGVVSYQRDIHDRYTAVAERDGRRSERVAIYRGIFGGSGNMAVRAGVFAELGGFDEALGAGTVACGGEDLEFLSRLLYSGRRLTVDPAVVVSHYHRDDYAGLCRQMYGYGAGYTAALAALVASDIRHLAGITRMARAIGPVIRERQQVHAHMPARFPAKLRWAEWRGLLAGPIAYVRSRGKVRSWRP